MDFADTDLINRVFSRVFRKRTNPTIDWLFSILERVFLNNTNTDYRSMNLITQDTTQHTVNMTEKKTLKEYLKERKNKNDRL